MRINTEKVAVVQRIVFCAGHRLWNYSGPCSSPHGHNYSVDLYVSAPELDKHGMIMDCLELKTLFGDWIEEHWDHGFLCHSEDTPLVEFLSSMPEAKCFCFSDNPTVEVMALYLLNTVGPKLLDGSGATLVRVALREVEMCGVDVSL